MNFFSGMRSIRIEILTKIDNKGNISKFIKSIDAPFWESFDQLSYVVVPAQKGGIGV
jgi:hypothetical protein